LPRPPKRRAVRHDPTAVYFKPAGVPMRALEEISLGRDELEALRLADVEDLSQEEVGASMNVSRATAGRILAEARRKTALALVYGKAIRVEGGTVETIAGGRDVSDRCDRLRPAAGERRSRGHERRRRT